jgi:hypothetical protein
MESALPGAMQSAYAIEVTVERDGTIVWNTGKVISQDSVAVPYTGKPLLPETNYAWRVRTWDSRDSASAWSCQQQFKTGTLHESGHGSRFTTPRYDVVQTPVSPRLIRQLVSGSVLVDFARDAFAGLDLTFEAPNPFTVHVHMGEAAEPDGRVCRTPPGTVRYHTVEMPVSSGSATVRVPLTTADMRLMPDSIVAVMPFRYVEIEGLPRDASVVSASQIMAHYPFDDSAATFQSSSPELDAVWDLCKYTMKATSFGGVFVDGDRERLPYEADALINQLGYYYCDREYTLARYSHEYLIVNPTWPTEWILDSVLIAWNDYLYTGDLTSIRAFYHDLKAKTLTDLSRADGLISSSNATPEILSAVYRDHIKDIVDWPFVEWDDYEFLPINTVVNAFHYRAVAIMAQIASALGFSDDAEAYRAQARRVYDSFNAVLYATVAGAYVDGEGSAHSSLHANMIALAFGLVPEDRQPRVMQFVRSKGMACSVYGAQFLLEACYATGMDDYAMELMSSSGPRSWLSMMRDLGATMTTEAWDGIVKPNQDWNHAWGAAPANIIPRFVMGIEPIDPGYRVVRIRPQPGGLSSAQIKTPTIRGAIEAAFDVTEHGFELTVQLPANMTAEVWLPRGTAEAAHLTLDEGDVTGRVEGRFLVLTGVGSGRHRIARRG